MLKYLCFCFTTTVAVVVEVAHPAVEKLLGWLITVIVADKTLQASPNCSLGTEVQAFEVLAADI